MDFRITSRLAKQAKGGQLAGASGVHIRLVPSPASGARDTGVRRFGPLLS